MAEQTKSQRNPRWPRRRRYLFGFIWLICLLISIAALVMPYSTLQSTLKLQVGDVSGQDVLAPFTLSYQSELLTAQQRAESANAVTAIYGPPDADVARDQLEQLRAGLAFINTVRQDSFASLDQKIDDLSALQNVNLSQETAQATLLLEEGAWQNVQQVVASSDRQ